MEDVCYKSLGNTLCENVTVVGFHYLVCQARVTADASLCCCVPYCGVPRMQKLSDPPVGAQGYQRFPLSKHVVDWNIALHAVPAYTSTSIPT